MFYHDVMFLKVKLHKIGNTVNTIYDIDQLPELIANQLWGNFTGYLYYQSGCICGFL